MVEVHDEFAEAKHQGTNLAGTLYVMRERDHITDQKFDYYKIGIVRGDKDVADREKQHRTGNPRAVETVLEVMSAAVQRLETRLHNHFANRRVSSGEWFLFPGSEYQELVKTVEQFSEVIERYAEIVASPQVDIDWNGAPRPDDGAGRAIAHALLIKRAALKILEENAKALSKTLLTIATSDSSLHVMLKESYVKASHNFSATELSKRFRSLYEQFKTKPRESVAFQITLEDESINLETERLRISRLISTESLSALDVYALHEQYLQIWSEKDSLVFEIEQLEAQLKQQVGSAPGLVGVAEWVRKQSMTFDAEAFKAQHPEMYEECRVYREARTNWNVAEWASYRRA